jgi:hypothetical protein
LWIWRDTRKRNHQKQKDQKKERGKDDDEEEEEADKIGDPLGERRWDWNGRDSKRLWDEQKLEKK